MKKNLLFFFIAVATLVQTKASAQAPTTFWSNNAVTTWYNASESTFSLTTAAELAGLAILVEGGNNFTGKTITLANDLDLGAHLWKPIGKNSTLTFSGTFDGNNHELSNLFATNTTTSFTGLFGQITGATVKNIRLLNPTISAKDDAGCIAGGLLNFALVTNCHATGVSISGTGANIGGLIGSLLGDSTISKSSSNGNVSGLQQIGGLVGSPYNLAFITECYTAGTVTGQIHVGGIAGYSAFTFAPNRPITIDNCYSRANLVSTDGPVAGIYGGASGQLIISNSYATGTITSDGVIGGFLGAVGNISGVNNYFNSETAGTVTGIGELNGPAGTISITAKATTEMKTAAMVALLNTNQANTPWTIDATLNDGYPILSSSLLDNPTFVSTKANVMLYPTVVADYVSISSSESLVSAKMYSISGSIMYSQILTGSVSKIDLSNFSAGIYFLNVTTEKGISTHKIIKK